MSWAAMARSSGTTASRARMVRLCVMAGSSASMAIRPLAHKLPPCQCAAMDVEILAFDGLLQIRGVLACGPAGVLTGSGYGEGLPSGGPGSAVLAAAGYAGVAAGGSSGVAGDPGRG